MNFKDQPHGQGLSVDEPGGNVSMKFAASMKSPFHCSNSKPSHSGTNCTGSTDIPNEIECDFLDLYGNSIPLATCTIANPAVPCTEKCGNDVGSPRALCKEYVLSFLC